ncbi:hypothetical protein CXG53_10815 [Pseudomonas guariconensis]|uniref:Uncharacterized protein n=1 Tax=Pseudomonas guariconensis TaxID=1288410 RepID=A0AAX0VZH3_9PSED|nr:hypothetical protein CXG49_08255 [Pseudomonas guariconensis]PLV24200.1 hypothetical protein CXG53_10815 [Pseudomonas guariconensis]PLV29223.1 hypothetical protein CXG51_11285 [Pseudomonas guariconensis]
MVRRHPCRTRHHLSRHRTLATNFQSPDPVFVLLGSDEGSYISGSRYGETGASRCCEAAPGFCAARTSSLRRVGIPPSRPQP